MVDDHSDEAVEDRDDDASAYALDAQLAGRLREAVSDADQATINALMEPLHPADIADLIEQLSDAERARFLAAWDTGIGGAILSELDEAIREDVLALIPQDALIEAVRELESDDVVDLVEDLPAQQQGAILRALDLSDRIAVQKSLSYPEESAGRLMQTEVARVPEHWIVGETIDWLRSHKTGLPENFYHVILVDPRMHPTGYVQLGRLLRTKRSVPLAQITEDSFRTIPADRHEDEVAYAFNQYHLISAPVVDAAERLVGVITIDDAMIVLNEVNEEDILRLAGAGGEESLADRTLQTVRQRFPWLAVNLVTAILASVVIAQFEAVLTQIVALAVLMPIVASMGGNAGTQSLTVAVRALATKDLTGSNLLRVVRREATAGLINGAVFAVVMGGIGVAWFGTPLLGVVIAAAMVINMVVAALAGILIPIGLDRAGIDPALASGAFVTTVTDVVGFFAFLGIAALVLL